MSYVNVIRAWKDEAYRRSLSDAERAQLPPSPVDFAALTEEDLDVIAGGRYAYTRIGEETPC